MERLFVVLASCLVGQSPAENATSGVTREQVFNAWQSRQNRVRDGHYEIEMTMTVAKGTQPGIKVKGKQGLNERKILPPEDTTHRHEIDLKFDSDGRFRIEQRGFGWSADEERFVDQHVVRCFDGAMAKRFYGPASENLARVAFVTPNAKSGPEFCGNDFRPVFLAFCSRHSELSNYLKLNDLKVSSMTGTVNGKHCAILDRVERESRYSYWVDPKCEYVVRRFLGECQGQVFFKIDIDYSQCEIGWAPTKWTTTMVYPQTGKVFESAVYLAKKYEFNLALDEHAFQFEFPVATRVNDDGEKQPYITTTSGGKRLTNSADLETGLLPQQLLDSDRRPLWVVFLSILTLLALAAVSVAIVRSRLRKNSSTAK